MKETKVIFEMETSDPDDFMTLLWLADHPDVRLMAVMVTPGGRDQCQLVRWALDRCGKKDVPIGALHGERWWNTQDGQKDRVSGFHYKVYGEDIKDHDPGRVHEGPLLVYDATSQCAEDVTYIVGSAPKNLGAAYRATSAIRLRCWVQQGGFAGDNLVPEADRLDKFKGRLTCPSFNPGGAPKQTLELLANPNIERKLFVSKNVCHGVIWDPTTQRTLKRKLCAGFLKRSEYEIANDLPAPPPPADWMSCLRTGLRTMVYDLDRYLADKGKAKAMHDLVAAACALDANVCRFSNPVEIYRERGEWGARLQKDSRTRISIGFNMDRFIEVLAR